MPPGGKWLRTLGFVPEWSQSGTIVAVQRNMLW